MKSRDAASQGRADLEQFSAMAQFFSGDPAELIEKIEGFAKYTSRQSLAKFLTKYEIFKQILNVNGSIVECGVFHGAGLLTWAKLSSIFEPANHLRKIIGFDTFEGFSGLSPKDTTTGTFQELKNGGLSGSRLSNLKEAVRIFDINRPINHISKIEVVEGDIRETASKHLENNPHLVVALLYLDLDLYEPTKAALQAFLPRMPKGSIIAFDELNAKIFPGETVAVDEVLGLKNLAIQRFTFDSYVSYAVIS